MSDPTNSAPEPATSPSGLVDNEWRKGDLPQPEPAAAPASDEAPTLPAAAAPAETVASEPTPASQAEPAAAPASDEAPTLPAAAAPVPTVAPEPTAAPTPEYAYVDGEWQRGDLPQPEPVDNVPDDAPAETVASEPAPASPPEPVEDMPDEALILPADAALASDDTLTPEAAAPAEAVASEPAPASPPEPVDAAPDEALTRPAVDALAEAVASEPAPASPPEPVEDMPDEALILEAAAAPVDAVPDEALTRPADAAPAEAVASEPAVAPSPDDADGDGEWQRGDLPQPESTSAWLEAATAPDQAEAGLPATPEALELISEPVPAAALAVEGADLAEPPPAAEEPLPPVGPPPVALNLEALVESLLFVADGAVPVARLAEALAVNAREVEAALEILAQTYTDRGLSLQRTRDRVQLTTAPAAAEKVQIFLGLAAAAPLSKAALETLAIIAYQQPVTRPQIDAVRGVNSDSVIKNLLTKGLIEEAGRTEGPGRPVLYGTTPEFLQHFGLTSLNDLPPLNLDGLRPVQPVEILKG